VGSFGGDSPNNNFLTIYLHKILKISVVQITKKRDSLLQMSINLFINLKLIEFFISIILKKVSYFYNNFFIMTQLTLNIPDNKMSFFMQLIKEFNYIKIKEVEPIILDEHKKIVRDIKAKTKKENFIDSESLFEKLDKVIL
jgi:hypothetical protein